jgi:dTDP-4-amino-4,6-dideoxygalactose transaminase
MANVPFLDLKAMHSEIADELNDAWQRVMATSAFIGGENVERFESEWAAYCGTRYAVGLSDGTAALELALRALGVGAGDEVIVPANTFFATWEAIVAVGARPAPIDVDPQTLLITREGVEAALTPQTAAVIAVHLYGQPVDMDGLNALAERAGIYVIEDAAQAHGATWRKKPAGGLSDVGCFSFYPGKNLGALGDAGAVVTNRADLAARIRSLANHGRSRDAADRHVYVGSNRRLDGLQAALLSVKLPHLAGWNAARRRIVRRYERLLSHAPVDFVSLARGAVSSHHLAVVQVEDRDEVRRLMTADGIGTGVHYRTPCHLQPPFARLSTRPLPVSENAAKRILSLPLFPQMTEEQVELAAASLKRAIVRAAEVRPPPSPGRRRGAGLPELVLSP